MNITTTYLFTLITNNDYNKLSEVIDSNKSRDRFFTLKARESLVSKAVLVRSKQCFDLLLNITPPEEYKNMEETCYLKGLYNALEYYVNAPNMENMYYLTKLLEKDITINYYSIYKAIHNTELFMQLFNKFNKNNINEITNLCNAAIMQKRDTIFKFIYNYFENNNINNIINNNFKNEMYMQAITSNDINIIEFLITKGHDWKVVNEYPSLYYAFTTKNISMFNYIYTKYKVLTKDELNAIPQIKVGPPLNFKYNIKQLNNFNKILLLPIEFNDITHDIAMMFIDLYSTYISSSHYHFISTIKKFKDKYIIMETLFAAKLIKSNPLLKINYHDFTKCYKKNIVALNGYPDHINIYKATVRKFLEICKANNYELDTFIL